ncbi:MAG: hypothetical protein IT537_15600 [Hyphomicrobiales bacterium]|nr:hypothetical protein [Hyphomicrobiales bacterium]
MLRVGYLPSDYHPLLLLLGEAEDMRRLAALLRAFAVAPQELSLGDSGFCVCAGTTVLLTATDTQPGLHPVAAGSRSLSWTLTVERAAHFADLLEQLATQTSGSAVLDVGILGEIPVKASIGEYPDAFLR